MTYIIEIPGQPFAKERPRHTKKGITYTPKKTVIYENQVKDIYQAKYGRTMLDGPLKAEITACYGLNRGDYSKATGLPNKKGREKLSGTEKPCKKPDVDNIAKAVLDSLNGIAYKDDSQVTEMSVVKLYDWEPRVILKLVADEG